MDTHRVESIRVKAPAKKAFSYIANPANLPEWTSAFKSVKNGTAVMATPLGSVEIQLQVTSSETHGTIDWEMTFPDQSVARAYSRVIPEANGGSVFSFVLLAPPVPLEQIEGALNQQAQTLREELYKLSAILD
jgi:uncharacterized membrane protein